MTYDPKTGRKQTKKRFNIADIVILLIIIAIIALFAYVIVSSYGQDLFEPKYSVEYTVKLTEVRKDFADNLGQGDMMVETTTLSEIGKVVKVDTTPCIFTATDSTGKTVTSDNPLYMDMVITVSAEATLPDGIYTVNGFRLTAGKNVTFRVPDFTGSGVCTGIKEVK